MRLNVEAFWISFIMVFNHSLHCLLYKTWPSICLVGLLIFWVVVAWRQKGVRRYRCFNFLYRESRKREMRGDKHSETMKVNTTWFTARKEAEKHDWCLQVCVPLGQNIFSYSNLIFKISQQRSCCNIILIFKWIVPYFRAQL